ncbi:response regulator receiver and SARP domain protein [Paenibacillus vortex V453]|jgi:two-component system LytT family response regulator|uniref:Response regulator receiver protein n=2 Tax=Paenibacillus TaxID=44249 RepID=A0A163FRR3_9BACL|nr:MULTISPECIES: response regulator [Paenibacillus]ANA79130.1 response regulator receiver protein [Paenibacillus glucanolyticus]AVV56938.1 response regulator receiver protein [Paenibacillus glucanolyticus]AWP26098.1 response regulator receiver protein [Paenibacillus sp. Cedars]EFU38858.1 response regulator receiver and SARP domain protein [Paenibacillus vortex V453]ETT39281.1 response regulator receiver and SARP domain-containing protein [Paenibacillus sp. FSL R5-808]
MKVILVDDEPLALKYLERQLLKLDTISIDVIGAYTNPFEGRKEILSRDVDIVFLDISLPELNGIELAEQLLEQKPHLCIVFVTGYHEYAVTAFELNAVDYIVKPVQIDRVAKTMERLRSRIAARPEEVMEPNRKIRMTMFRQVMVEQPNDPGQFAMLHWRTTRAQEIFIYMLQHRGQLVRKSALIDMLWPEFDMDKAYPQLYTAIYHIRKTLEPYDTRFQITNTTEGYVLNIEDVQLDIEEWENWFSSNPSVSAASIDRHIEMMKLYTGDYLQEYDYWWAEGERQRLKELWLTSSLCMADWYVEQERMDEAILCYSSIQRQHPMEEKAYFSLMKLYVMQDNPAQVHRQFALLSQLLRDEMGEEPSPYIKKWYDEWNHGAHTESLN